MRSEGHWQTHSSLVGRLRVEESIDVESLLGHLLLNIALFGNVLPELAGSVGARDSAGETDNDARVLGGSVNLRGHFDQIAELRNRYADLWKPESSR